MQRQERIGTRSSYAVAEYTLGCNFCSSGRQDRSFHRLQLTYLALNIFFFLMFITGFSNRTVVVFCSLLVILCSYL